MITWIIIVIFIILAIFFIKLSHFRHKTFIIFLILLALFLYTTLSIVNAKNKLEFNTTEGFLKSMKIYGGWLANGFENLKSLAGNAIKMDWTSTNKTSLNMSKSNP